MTEPEHDEQDVPVVQTDNRPRDHDPAQTVSQDPEVNYSRESHR